jgi:hypothetical protein
MASFLQIVSLGDIVKSAFGFLLSVIGSIVACEVPQGFCAVIFICNEFVNPPWLVYPQEEALNYHTIVSGGGCVYV